MPAYNIEKETATSKIFDHQIEPNKNFKKWHLNNFNFRFQLDFTVHPPVKFTLYTELRKRSISVKYLVIVYPDMQRT